MCGTSIYSSNTKRQRGLRWVFLPFSNVCGSPVAKAALARTHSKTCGRTAASIRREASWSACATAPLCRSRARCFQESILKAFCSVETFPDSCCSGSARALACSVRRLAEHLAFRGAAKNPGRRPRSWGKVFNRAKAFHHPILLEPGPMLKRERAAIVERELWPGDQPIVKDLLANAEAVEDALARRLRKGARRDNVFHVASPPPPLPP